MRVNGLMIRKQAKVLLFTKAIGIMYYHNGDIYEGDWKDGKRSGKGR